MTLFLKLLSSFIEAANTRNTTQLRSRTTNDDEPMETNSANDNDDDNDNDNMYVRAREKHNRANQQQPEEDHNEEQVMNELPKKVLPKPAVKVRRINDETTQVYDDEQIEMGVGGNSKKKKREKAKQKENEPKSNTKENDLSATMPINHEKKRQAEETRIERIQRLCEKRTVGDVLEIAQQAYYERQQKRNLFKDYIERAES